MDTLMPKKLGLFDLHALDNLLENVVSLIRQVMRSIGLNPTNREISEMMIQMDQNGTVQSDERKNERSIRAF